MSLDLDAVKEKLQDKKWRINNLYKIKDVSGTVVQFKMNWAQENLFDNLWYFNVILKARQLGFSTFIMLYNLDSCLFENNHACGVIAQGMTEAQDLFENKVKFAYDNLPDWLREMRTCESDSARRLVFNNGSNFTVGTSLRGGTFQKLHVSEYGKISARYPDKAIEIKTGALNTVHIGQIMFIESTAEGRSGEFYDLCMRAIRIKESKKRLTSLDPRLHFYSWYNNPNNVLSDEDSASVLIDEKMTEYFDKIGGLTSGQKAWYVKKLEQMGDVQMMRREHPSDWHECFEASMEGAYYTHAMSMLRRNGGIGEIAYDPAYKVDTFWDIGANDQMAIWFMQKIGNQFRFIRYYQNNDYGLEHYASKMNSFGYVYGKHYFPHDGVRRQIGEGLRSTKQIAEGLGIRPVVIVPRTRSVLDDIQKVRTVIPRCKFDEVGCKDGIVCLDGYRKRWDDKNGVWMDEPYHDQCSHGADAFRTFVMGFKELESDYNDAGENKTADGGEDLFY